MVGYPWAGAATKGESEQLTFLKESNGHLRQEVGVMKWKYEQMSKELEELRKKYEELSEGKALTMLLV